MERKNIFYSICSLAFVGVVFWVFLPHIIEHTPIFIDKKFIVSCPKIGKTVLITISKVGFSPKVTNATSCDRIVFKNIEEKTLYQIAFGDHPAHFVYPGFKEQILGPGQEIYFIANAFGKYKIHDHLRDIIEGEIDIII